MAYICILLGLAGASAIFFAFKPPKKYPIDLTNQKRALNLIWDKFFEQTTVAPKVVWKCGTELNCSRGGGFYIKSTKGKNVCVAGIFLPEPYTVIVAWPSTAKNISDTAFAHELQHAALFNDYRDADPGHTLTEIWGRRGQVVRANNLLKDRGM